MEQNDQNIFITLELLRTALQGEAFCPPVNTDWDVGYQELHCHVAQRLSVELLVKHDLAHLVAHGLEKMNLPASEALDKFKTSKMRAIYRYARMQYEYERICSILEEANIIFVPLKGAVLRQYYPEPWMRTSCDIDILVREEELDAAERVLCAQGWIRKGEKGFHDISLFSPTGVHLELHFSILENIPTLDPVLGTVWEHVLPVEGKIAEHRMTNEFFLFHHLAHMSYHFVNGGCGIRPFLDLWILKQNICWNQKKLRELCIEAGLDQFCDKCMELTEVWFGDKNHSAITQHMEDYIFQGGVYGTMSNRVMIDQAKSGNRWKNLVNRLFMPYYKMKVRYPILEKRKWLTPVYYIVRWWQLITQGKLNRAMKEFAVNQSSSEKEITEAGLFLEELGLRQ